jgi:hypothetical protein
MEISYEWSLDELYEAHAVLDLYDELEQRAEQVARMRQHR